MIKIIHFSTVHLRDDSRIRSKMMASLHGRYPGQVTLLVQDGLGNEADVEGYSVIDTGPKLNRLWRMSLGGWRMFRAVLKEKPAVAHFHDPELIPWAALLRAFGVRIIYDVHEDYPEAVSENYRLPAFARKTLPTIVRAIEWVGGSLFDGIVAVTSQIEGRFPKQKTVQVRNWPILDEFHSPIGRPMAERPREVAYIGTITQNRNIIGMLEAIHSLRHTNVQLRLAGDFTVENDRALAQAHASWDLVRFDGWVARAGVADILASARAGLVVLKPIEHETLTLPIKLFEYMAAGVPVISSDFPLWREIVENVGCGLLVDPMRPDEIAEAIQWIIDNPESAEEMGARGRKAVVDQFNWGQEAKQLFQLYDRVLERA